MLYSREDHNLAHQLHTNKTLKKKKRRAHRPFPAGGAEKAVWEGFLDKEADFVPC